jgi:hypothetical protein
VEGQDRVRGRVTVEDGDDTLFEVGRRLEYSSQRTEKKEFTHRQQRKMSKYTITAKGKEGKRAKTRMERGRREKLTGKMQILLYNTKHTHTHMFSEYRLLCISCICTYITHTHTHTFSVYVSLWFVYVCDQERVGFSSFSRCV